MANLAILTTPKAVLPTFVMAADRYYWAQPRQVAVLYSDREGLVWVQEPRDGARPFPTNGEWLRWSDTQRSLAAAARRRRAA